jgi:hypothetical protein
MQRVRGRGGFMLFIANVVCTLINFIQLKTNIDKRLPINTLLFFAFSSIFNIITSGILLIMAISDDVEDASATTGSGSSGKEERKRLCIPSAAHRQYGACLGSRDFPDAVVVGDQSDAL